ncbi:hypothetical protein CAP36_00395 [Chitinophagaceae bacterium IBVUCB2]|nr:hypothetical protein CAP36_00395 [Chitinophagaceae bacterium IBVUCB2]
MRKTLLLLFSFFIVIAPITQLSAAIVVPASAVSTEPDPATVKAATDAFKNLSKKEKREKAKEVKKEIKAFKAAKKAGNAAETNTLLLVILAILLPPLAVYLHQGEINSKFWISLLLTLLFWLPGVIYALVVILGNK